LRHNDGSEQAGAVTPSIYAVFVFLTISLTACARHAPVPTPTGFALRTTAEGHVALGSQGEITGPTLQLARTAAGYRGFAGGANVDVRAEGDHILGSIQSRVIDLRYHVEGTGLVISGLFAGRMGRLTASHAEIRSALGVCSYVLAAVGSYYEGERSCSYSVVPSDQLHRLKLPDGFNRLPVDRQAMVLALLLST
jgi:hypothetical protein